MATANDAAAILPLFRDFYQEHLAPQTVEAIARHLDAAQNLHTVILAPEGDVVIGFASLRLLPQLELDIPHAELSDIFVAKESRRRGVASRLIAFAEDFERKRDARTMVLVTGFDNEEARACYRAAGYIDWALAVKKRLAEQRGRVRGLDSGGRGHGTRGSHL